MASVIPHDDDDSDGDFDEKTAKTTMANDLANDFAAIASSTSATASSGTSTLGLRPRIPEMEFPVDKPIRREGQFRKEGGNHKSWKTRLFHLDEEKISYYKPGQLKSPLGTIYLRDYVCAAVTANRPSIPFCFSLQGILSSQRVYYFAANSREQMNEWITTINQSIRYGRIARQVSLYDTISHETALICIRQLMDHTDVDGLLFSSGNVSQVKVCMNAVKRGKIPDVVSVPNPCTVASLLKTLFKDGPLKYLVIGPVAKILEKADKRKTQSTTHLAQSFGIYLFGELSVQQAELVLEYLISNMDEIM
ncbi:rho GTPase-activating protein 24-like isoform X2 [Oscarella lobularis]|uniref:rho GTPase-activating protein 24-like isoform X2 n=1 Tax=Oscarella lobularis TaxID=121494 RepID=UPI0033136FBE